MSNNLFTLYGGFWFVLYLALGAFAYTDLFINVKFPFLQHGLLLSSKVFWFTRNYHFVFQNGRAIFHSHQQQVGEPSAQRSPGCLLSVSVNVFFFFLPF